METQGYFSPQATPLGVFNFFNPIKRYTTFTDVLTMDPTKKMKPPEKGLNKTSPGGLVSGHTFREEG